MNKIPFADFSVSALRKMFAAALILLFALAAAVWLRAPFAFEQDWLLRLHRHIGSAFYPIAAALHFIGSTKYAVIWIAVCTALLFFRRHTQQALLLGGASFMSALSIALIKAIVERPRPQAFAHLIEQHGWSFPSGHSSIGAVLAMWLVLSGFFPQRRRLLVFSALLFTLLMGFSRPYLGVHYPTDVLAGWANGVLSCLAVYFLLNKVRIKNDASSAPYPAVSPQRPR